MRDSVQFRLNVLKETPEPQELSGKNVWFRLDQINEETKKVRTEIFVKFEEHVVKEWNWIDTRCIICFALIKSDMQTSIWKCPHCGKLAHFDHVVSWIQEKQKCPVCRQPVEL